jgi:signal transduction histidine kinase
MRPWEAEHPLALSLIAFVVVMVLSLTIALVVIAEVSGDDVTTGLLERRGHSAVQNLKDRLRDERSTDELLAELVASGAGVSDALTSADPSDLARSLVPIRSRLGIQELQVHDMEGSLAFWLSPGNPLTDVADLVAAAREGLTTSWVAVTADGLVVAAASPVMDATGMVGTAVVARTMDPDDLVQLAEGADASLVLYGNGRVVGVAEHVHGHTEAHEASVEAALQDYGALDPGLGASGLIVGDHFIASLALEDGGSIVALVEVGDVNAARATRRRTMILGAAVAALIAAIGGLYLARGVTRPLEAMARAAASIGAGDYGKRLERHRTSELQSLASTINQLAVDVSGRVQALTLAEREMAELVASKDELIGAVSHELRTPLTAIVGYAELLRSVSPDLSDADRREMLEAIASESLDLSNIIEDLLVASRAESGQLQVAAERVVLASEVQRVLDVMATDGRALITQLEPGAARGDAGRVRQIVRNLISNALRYGGNEITVKVSTADDTATVTVADNGTGIPPEAVDRVFEPYERAHELKGLTASVGLGLSVSRKLARLMGGDLVYSSNGGGATFTLTLPVYADVTVS